MTAGLCSNADKLDARATDPKTRPQARHARSPASRVDFLRNFARLRHRHEMAAALL
jgi:hypothetical protein